MIKENDKILMIAATPFFSDRGCHIRIYNEIKYLAKEGIQVVLCTYHLGNDIPGFEIKRIPNVTWYTKLAPGASWGKFYLDFLLLKLSLSEYFKNKPRIIHAHLYEGLLIAFFIKIVSLFRVKIIFDCQGSLAEEMYAYTLKKYPFLKPLYYLFFILEKALLYLPDHTVCSSQNSYDFLTSKYNVSKKRISIVQDGIDTDLFTVHKENKNELKDSFGIPRDSKVILYTGSMAEAKGVKELLDAIPLILEKNKDLAFIFAGYGELEDEYRRRHQSYVESKNIFFVGRFSYFDLPKYTAIADYAIDPKKDSSESSGKLLNYVAAGLPVICFKNVFNFSVLNNTGIYIDDFIKIVNLNDPKEREPLIENHDFSWEIHIKKLLTVYRSLLVK